MHGGLKSTFAFVSLSPAATRARLHLDGDALWTHDLVRYKGGGERFSCCNVPFAMHATLVMGPQNNLMNAWRTQEHLQELSYTQLRGSGSPKDHVDMYQWCCMLMLTFRTSVSCLGPQSSITTAPPRSTQEQLQGLS